MKKTLYAVFLLSVCFSFQIFAQIPIKTLVEIVRAEDELRYDKTLEDLMKSGDAAVRKRAALAAGRVGNEAAVPALTDLLLNDKSAEVRSTAAFALGEIESIKAADAILQVLKNQKNPDEIRARATEAAGKIAAANAKDEKSKNLGEAILETLEFEVERGAKQSRDVVLLGLTAALRARPDKTDSVVAEFLTNRDERIRADAANTLTRIRAKNSNEKLREILKNDNYAIARANAARALGAAENKDAVNLLVEAAMTDKDERVRVSAIRSLAILKDAESANKLLERGEKLLADYKKSKFAHPVEKNELLEIATALGRILPNTSNERALNFLDEFIAADVLQSPEISVARLRVAHSRFNSNLNLKGNWQELSSLVQVMGEFSALEPLSGEAKVLRDEAPEDLRGIIRDFPNLAKNEPKIVLAFPDVLRAFAAFKTEDAPQVLSAQLKNSDVFVRAAAAELLGEQPAAKESIEALKNAFAESIKTDKNYDDAQLAILSALVKLDKQAAADSLRLALDAPNFLVRRRAAELIRQNDLQKDFPGFEQKLGTVRLYNAKTGTKLGQILNTETDYRRAVSRKSAQAVITTEKGSFTIEFLPAEAPLTVDNFIKLAKSGYFNGLMVHRVVPNFVMQDGDPRGDGSGGPGWNIRDEMNMVPYERGAVGMALSGKDTGGSQWFVTHSPQPHLDGGYTVFGRVNEADMKVVDKIVRGDRITSVKIVEEFSGKSARKN